MENLHRVIRIFISSTFRDFGTERNDMARELYPALREYCEKRNFFFRAVDLRWGVSDKDGDNRRTMEICLDEIERCQRISPTLNFLALHSECYGTRFLPGQISREDWARLLRDGGIPEAERRELEEWYREDKNAARNPMVLRPKRAETEQEKAEEEAEENRLMGILFPAAQRIFPNQSNLPDVRRLPYGASATELEIWKGLFLADGARRNTLVFLRDFDKPEKPPQYGFGAEELRERLIQFAQPPDSAPLIRLDKEKRYLVDKDEEGNKRYLARARHLLLGMIAKRIREVEEQERRTSPAQRERLKVDAELSRVSEEYLDFDDRMKRFSEFVRKNRGKVVFVTGEQGSGKTALLKAWIHENRKNSISVFGDTQASGRFMAQVTESFLSQLRELGLKPDAAPETDDPITRLETALAESGPPDGMKITAALDSLEAVADIGAQKRTLFSLRLPDWITLAIVSAQDNAPEGVPALSLEPLENQAATELLFRMLARKGIRLTDETDGGKVTQTRFARQFIPKRRVTPLYLAQVVQYFAFRKFRSFEAPPNVSAYPSGLEEMTEFLLENLDGFIDDVQRRMFRRVLGYVALSSEGLSEEELLLLLERDEPVKQAVQEDVYARHAGCHKCARRNICNRTTDACEKYKEAEREKKITDFALAIYAHWARIFPMLGVFCVESESQSGPLFRFRHALLKETVRKSVERQEDMSYLLKNVKLFFLEEKVFFPLDNPGKQVAQYRQSATPNYRRVAELYPLLRQSNDPYALAGMFEDLSVIDAYIRAGEYPRLRMELEEALSFRPENQKLLAARDCLRRWDFLFRAYPEGGFLPAYAREHPEAVPALRNAGHSACLEIRCPDGARTEIEGIYLRGVSSSEAALSDEGLIAVMKGDKIRLYDWNTRSHTGIERIVAERERGPVFLYWTEGRKLVARFEHFRVTFAYTGRTLEELSRKRCPELKLVSNAAEEPMTETEFREADESGYDEETLIWYHADGKARRTNLCYPLGTRVRAYRHGRIAAILVEKRFIDLTDLAAGVRLARLEIPAAQARFSPDGRRLLICQEDDTALCYEISGEYPNAVPLPKYGMTRRKYAALYALELLKRALTTFSAPFEAFKRDDTPFGALQNDTRAPLLACMSVNKRWLALYYHYQASSVVRAYHLDADNGIGELLAESRVQPIYWKDIDSRPFRASEDEKAVILISGGIRHVWDTETWKWKTGGEAEPLNEPWRALLEDRRRHALTWRDMLHGKQTAIQTPMEALARAITFLYFPRLPRNLELTDSDAGLITLKGDSYLWILDRESRLIHLASRDGEWLCHSQMDRGFLTAAVSGDDLYILPTDSVQLIRLHPHEMKS